jgi:hypothetical protein
MPTSNVTPSDEEIAEAALLGVELFMFTHHGMRGRWTVLNTGFFKFGGSQRNLLGHLYDNSFCATPREALDAYITIASSPEPSLD